MLNFKNLSPIHWFLIKAFSLYIFWYLFYELWLHPKGDFDLLVIDNIISISEYLLDLFGFIVIPDVYDASFRTLGVDGTHGIWIGDSCNGITIFALFTGFIIAFPGKWIRKLIYIPIGILFIHILNILRVMALSLILKYAPETLSFNHSYTFTTIIYAFIFLLWYLWATKYNGELTFNTKNEVE